MSDIPEPDCLDGAPHPRHTGQVFGHQAAEAVFLDAFNADRLHHAWLISGPKGIGKATLAWRLARFLLATPEDDGGFFVAPKPETLDIPVTDPVAHRLLALSEPRLFLLRRPYDEKTERLRGDITVDETRILRNFLSLSAADGGRRVVIIDSADEIQTAWLDGKKSVGVTAGASAPEVLVEQVVKTLRDRGGISVNEIPGIKEQVVFSLPRELAKVEEVAVD